MAMTLRRQAQLLIMTSVATSFAGLTYHRYGAKGLVLALLALVLYLVLAKSTATRPGLIALQIVGLLALVSFHGYLFYLQLGLLGLPVLGLLILVFYFVVQRDPSLRTS